MLGQPAQDWTVKRFRADPGYADWVAATLVVQGSGTVGVGPNGSAPWRLWLGPKV